MSVFVDIHHNHHGFKLEARFESSGRLTALFGRSGAGKSTLIGLIAGLLHPDEGRIVIDNIPLVDTQLGICVPKNKRRIGYVFQEDRLFPHLSVKRNLMYGQMLRKKSERYTNIDDVADLLGIASLFDRRPEFLSGGEKQRVAIGRALLASPKLLLMDEPLAALDDARKAEILPYIERLRDEIGIPIVYVSHSVAEVARLATTVVTMADGKVTGVGRPNEVLSRPNLAAGTDEAEAGAILRATIQCHDEVYGLTTLLAAGGTITVPRLDRPIGTLVRVRVRARDVILAVDRPSGLSALNVLPATVSEIGEGRGAVVDVRVKAGDADLIARVTKRSVDALNLTVGRSVFAIVKSIAFDDASLSLMPHFSSSLDAGSAKSQL